MPVRRVVLVASLAFACGDELANEGDSDGGEQALEAICGRPGPFRLLPLAPGTVPHWMPIDRIGDRLYVNIKPELGANQGFWEDPLASAVHSVGPCGEDPVRVADDVLGVFEKEFWPGVVLGCQGRDSSLGIPLYFDMVVLDPAGAEAPRLVFEDSCTGKWTAAGVVVDEPLDACCEPRRVLLYPLPADPLAGPFVPEVLFEAVEYHSLRVLEREAFALTPGGELVRADLVDRSISLVEDGVRGFEVARDGRYLAWHAAAPPGDPEGPSTVSLRDRESGVDVDVAVSSDVRASFHNGRLRLRMGPEWRERLVYLPSLAIADLPVDRSAIRELADGRWVVGTSSWRGPYTVRDVFSGEEVLIYGGDEDGSVGDDALEVRVDPADEAGDRALWQFYYDGSPPRQLARRARYHEILPDGRVLVNVELDERDRGTLYLVDPEALGEQLVATDVHDNDFSLADPAIFGAALGDDVVVYTSLADENPGIYLARLPPP